MCLVNKARQTIRRYALIKKADRVTVGVSGGPDSVALLYILNSLKKELGLKLHIAHLNHMLRGRESQEDAVFVMRLAQRLRLPVTIKNINVKGQGNGASLEEAARRIRLEFLFEASRDSKSKKIALGHSLDDQAETVLMRIIRGSGLLGLCAISPKRKMGEFTIIRPLIEASRKEIEGFLKLEKIKSRTDSSNFRQEYFRNRIRHSLLPEMRKYNPNIKEVLANTAENIAYDYDFLYKNGLKAFCRVAAGKTKNRSGLRLRLDKYLRLHVSLQNTLLRLAYEELKGDTRRLTYRHIKEIRDLACNRPDGSVVDLPSCISVSKTPPYLSVYLR